MSKTSGDLIIAIDAGGTMTDCVLVSDDGTFTVGKSLRNVSTNFGQPSTQFNGL